MRLRLRLVVSCLLLAAAALNGGRVLHRQPDSPCLLQPLLVYNTDRITSSIRLLPLTSNGQHAAGTSVELFRKEKVRQRSRAVRPMYGADLDWVDGIPVVAGFP